MDKNKIDLTIIIPCSSDTRIGDCIRSIYQTCFSDAEILVSLNNASKEVKDIVRSFPDVKTCEIKQPNLSMAYNHGIECASRNNILLMDSDCLFAPKTIELLYKGLKNANLAKGLVVFRTNNLISKIIGKVREYTTTDFVSAYVPPLAFRKSIKNLIGGYYFREEMSWSGDGEFDYRIRKIGLKIHYDPKAVIYHAALSFLRDVKSGFRYGKGRRVGADLKLLPKRDYSKIAIHAERFKKTYEVFRRKGALAALYYLFVWRPIYRLGYIMQGFHN